MKTCVDCGKTLVNSRAKRCKPCAANEPGKIAKGRLTAMAPEKDLARFEALVSPEPMSGCWLWTGSLYPSGYGRRRIGTVTRVASREAWRLYRGPIPSGLCVCHRCDNPPCVNPDHLFLGTIKDNAYDMIAKGRHSHGASHVASMRPPRGMQHNRAKVTDDQVIAIRRAYKEGGETHRSLALRFGINHSSIGCILRGTRWRHVK